MLHHSINWANEMEVFTSWKSSSSRAFSSIRTMHFLPPNQVALQLWLKHSWVSNSIMLVVEQRQGAQSPFIWSTTLLVCNLLAIFLLRSLENKKSVWKNYRQDLSAMSRNAFFDLNTMLSSLPNVVKNQRSHSSLNWVKLADLIGLFLPCDFISRDCHLRHEINSFKSPTWCEIHVFIFWHQPVFLFWFHFWHSYYKASY